MRRITEVEAKYYADGEDAYAMRRSLEKFRQPNAKPKKTKDATAAEGTSSIVPEYLVEG